jgi:hypothetical protein
VSECPAEWKPVWAMTRAEREDYAELRSSLEELGCTCLTCLDVGLPCYHREPHEMTRVLSMVPGPMEVR